MQQNYRKKVGFIGSGVGALGAAWLLNDYCDVTIFERDSWAGGHGHSPEVEILGKKYRFDLGVQFVSPAFYPCIYAALQLQQFKDIKITAAPVTTFSAARSPEGRRWLWGNTSDYQELDDVQRWVWTPETIAEANKLMLHLQYMSQQEQLQTVGVWLKQNNYSDLFIQACLQPLLSILNVTRNGLLDTNFTTLSRLVPGLLSFTNGTTWYRFDNQVKSFIDALSAPFADSILLNQQVLGCWPTDDGKVQLEVKDSSSGETKVYTFDEVVYNGTLSYAQSLLNNPKNPNWAKQSKYLAPFTSERSNCYLHQDPSYLPAGIPFTSATVWNSETKSPRMSYNQTVIRGLQAELNPGVWMSYGDPVDAPSHQLIEPVVWDHPLDSSLIFGAKRQLYNIQGLGKVWYCGGNTTVDAFNSAFVSGLIIATKLSDQAQFPFTADTPIDQAARVNFTEYKIGYMFPSTRIESEFATVVAEHLPGWLEAAVANEVSG
jgi:predicted NAD/FAD-binding protein